jgi:hypothetical protein
MQTRAAVLLRRPTKQGKTPPHKTQRPQTAPTLAPDSSQLAASERRPALSSAPASGRSARPSPAAPPRSRTSGASWSPRALPALFAPSAASCPEQMLSTPSSLLRVSPCCLQSSPCNHTHLCCFAPDVSSAACSTSPLHPGCSWLAVFSRGSLLTRSLYCPSWSDCMPFPEAELVIEEEPDSSSELAGHDVAPMQALPECATNEEVRHFVGTVFRALIGVRTGAGDGRGRAG